MTEQQLNVTLLPITQVHPDPRQPRRLLPRDLANAFVEGALALDVLATLRVRAERNKGIRERLQELDALADSIATDGLYQPIRVIQEPDERYRIEQGERRWWAHHVLLGRGDERFRVIPAFVIEPDAADEGVLRRQVSENVHRSDFTAMELARAMADRMAEIASLEPGLPRREIERRVGKENGMTDRRVRQFVALLSLAPAVQELAQEARLGEGALRPLVHKEPERQMLALRKLMSAPRKRSVIATHLLESKRDRRKERKKSSRARKARGVSRRTKSPKRSVANQIIRLARMWRAEQSKTAERELAARVFHNADDSKALADLRDSLDRVLAQPNANDPKRSAPQKAHAR